MAIQEVNLLFLYISSIYFSKDFFVKAKTLIKFLCIYSLESHSLSHKLSWLLSDKEHLLSCLEPWAFLCQENLAEATLLYLRAIERNQPVLFAEIDPCLVSIIFWHYL